MGPFSKLKKVHKAVKPGGKASPVGILRGGVKRKPAQGKGPAVAGPQRSTGSAPLSPPPRGTGGPSPQGTRIGRAIPTKPLQVSPAKKPAQAKGLALRRPSAPLTRPRTRLK